METRRSRAGGNLDRKVRQGLSSNPAHPEPVEGLPRRGKTSNGEPSFPRRREPRPEKLSKAQQQFRSPQACRRTAKTSTGKVIQEVNRQPS